MTSAARLREVVHHLPPLLRPGRYTFFLKGLQITFSLEEDVDQDLCIFGESRRLSRNKFQINSTNQDM